MGLEQKFDSGIKAALERKCDGISASDELKRRIDETIREKEENSMKHMNVKRLCIGVAAACLLASGVTAFAGGAAYFVAASATEPIWTDYTQLGRLEKELGYGVDSVERFENGYAFAGVSVETIEAYTGEHDKVYSIPSMNIRYTNGDKKMDLDINEKPTQSASPKEPVAIKKCGDIDLRYDEYAYKIVLVNDSYVPTKEDEIATQRGDYSISYVTVTMNEKEKTADEEIAITSCDEGNVRRSMSVSWEKDGISYELSGDDLDMSADEMFAMAEEILSASRGQ